MYAVSTDVCLHWVFQARLSMVRVRVTVWCPCDLGYKCWSQKLESLGYRSVIKHYPRVISFDASSACDGQTDTPPVARSCSGIAERYKRF